MSTVDFRFKYCSTVVMYFIFEDIKFLDIKKL